MMDQRRHVAGFTYQLEPSSYVGILVHPMILVYTIFEFLIPAKLLAKLTRHGYVEMRYNRKTSSRRAYCTSKLPPYSAL